MAIVTRNSYLELLLEPDMSSETILIRSCNRSAGIYEARLLRIIQGLPSNDNTQKILVMCVLASISFRYRVEEMINDGGIILPPEMMSGKRVNMSMMSQIGHLICMEPNTGLSKAGTELKAKYLFFRERDFVTTQKLKKHRKRISTYNTKAFSEEFKKKVPSLYKRGPLDTISFFFYMLVFLLVWPLKQLWYIFRTAIITIWFLLKCLIILAVIVGSLACIRYIRTFTIEEIVIYLMGELLSLTFAFCLFHILLQHLRSSFISLFSWDPVSDEKMNLGSILLSVKCTLNIRYIRTLTIGEIVIYLIGELLFLIFAFCHFGILLQHLRSSFISLFSQDPVLDKMMNYLRGILLSLILSIYTFTKLLQLLRNAFISLFSQDPFPEASYHDRNW